MKGKSFAEKYPEIALDWDYEKNDTTPDEVYSSEDVYRFWKCHICGYEWKSKTHWRTSNKRGCKKCGYKLVAEKQVQHALKREGSLLEKYPDLCKEWDYEKNDKTPEQIPVGSKYHAYWKCNTCGGSWQLDVSDRAGRKTKCPFCSHKRALKGFNDFETWCTINNRQDLLDDWDYANNEKTPDMYLPHSNTERVNWKCAYCGYTWPTTIANRTAKQGTGCRRCSGLLQTSFPEQVFFYYISQAYPDSINGYKNAFDAGMELDIYIPSIKTGIEYDGIVFHKNNKNQSRDQRKYSICQKLGIKLIRIKEDSDDESNCDVLIQIKSKPKSKDFKHAFSVLRQYINFPENTDIERDETEIKKSYFTMIRNNNLAIIRPDIASEWDYEKNEPFIPEMFRPMSKEKVHWKCKKCGGSWPAEIGSRTGLENGCPYCAGQKPIKGKTDLLTRYPEYAKYWDYEKNDKTPDKVMPGSNTPYYWICPECGNSFQRKPHNVTGNKSVTCRKCAAIRGATKASHSRDNYKKKHNLS